MTAPRPWSRRATSSPPGSGRRMRGSFRTRRGLRPLTGGATTWQTQRFEVRPIDAPLGADIVGFPFDDFTATTSPPCARPGSTIRSCASATSPSTTTRRSASPPCSARSSSTRARCRKARTRASREILVVSNMKDADGTPAGDLGDGEVKWHTDTWFKEQPPSASILRALKVPPTAATRTSAICIAAYETPAADAQEGDRGSLRSTTRRSSTAAATCAWA